MSGRLWGGGGAEKVGEWVGGWVCVCVCVCVCGGGGVAKTNKISTHRGSNRVTQILDALGRTKEYSRTQMVQSRT